MTRVTMWHHRGLAVKNKETMMQKEREKTGPSLQEAGPHPFYSLPPAVS